MKREIELKKGKDKNAKLVVTEIHEIDVEEVADVQETINQIDRELFAIIAQVKALKKRAEELKKIKEMLLNKK